MPTDYSSNYSPEYLASLPAKVRTALTGNYTPGSEGIRGVFQNVFSPIAKLTSPIANQSVKAAQWQARNPAYAKHLGMAALLFGGAGVAGAFGGGTFAGAGGGLGAGAGGGLGAGASAATVNPFAAGAGLSTGWAPIASGVGASAAPSVLGGAGAAAGSAGAAGAGTAGAATTPWYNSFWGQTALNTGGNLLGGFMQNRAISQAQNQSNQQIQDRIRQALAALSPEQIMALARQFLPQMAAMMNQAGQTAIQGVREQAARTGQLEGPRALNFEAGVRSNIANDVQRRAFEAAFNTAGAQAGAITGAPYTPIQPQMGYADAIMNSLNQAYLSRALSQQQQPGTPYRWPGQNPYYPWQEGG